MGSQWFNQATGWNNGGYDQISCNTEKNVDLTLKLGLPNDHDHDQHHLRQYFSSTTTLVTNQPAAANLNFNSLIHSSQGTRQYYVAANAREDAGLNHYGAGGGEAGIQNHHGIINRGAAGVIRRHGVVNGDNLNEPWNHPDYFSLNDDTSTQHTGSVVGIPVYHDDYNSFNGNHGISPTLTMNGNSILDTTARIVDPGHEIGSSSGSRRRSARRQHEESHSDPNKRCTNYSCNTNDTPMWRKGPFGPKTLCNACGIKYRKEEEKRRAREVAKRTNGN